MEKLTIGTPFSDNTTKVMLLGAGELGKEVVIELQRYGVEVIAVDRYKNAPAMQVAHRSFVIDMLDAKSLRKLIENEKPDYVVPEIEAIATNELVALESEGVRVVPSARAVNLTMNREGIRRLAAEELGLPTSSYMFADTFEAFNEAVSNIGMPCVVKPIMSSSGKGQSILKTEDQMKAVWDYAQEGGRAGAGKVIVEGFVDFDYEITLLTCRHAGGITFCAPIGHIQVDGDYRESWQPQAMSEVALTKAQEVASKVTESLGGWGIFGVELFVKGDDIYFSEVSPRPHDTGMVTMISQNYSEFAIHVKAFLGLPVPEIEIKGFSASAVLLVNGDSSSMRYTGMEAALSIPGTELRLFGKPEVKGKRRLGVALAESDSIEGAREKAGKVIKSIEVSL